MTDNILQQIQTLQFNEKDEAETLLLDFIRETFPDLDSVKVELRPQAVSLNSFNGYLHLADETVLFFKTHTEEDNVIDEYYNAQMLDEAGYRVIKPLYNSTQAGQHLLIYPLIEDPAVFDLAWDIERGEDSETLPALRLAQQAADDRLLDHYRRTLFPQTAVDAATAPVHQLFYHRLVGGRLERFYGALPGQRSEPIQVKLPGGKPMVMHKLRRVKWIINGQEYEETLDDLIRRAIDTLDPSQPGPSVIGHGDAHNGNVFYMAEEQPPVLSYFDPAFAGRHHPLLDLAKPLFHNVFAMWMYFPKVKQRTTKVWLKRGRSYNWAVTYEYDLPEVRQMFLQSKVDRVLIPLLQELKRRGELQANWRRYLKAALFCCAFLTLDLTDRERFPSKIALLGLAMSVEMGGESNGERSLIDQTLDNVARVLAMTDKAPTDRWQG